MYIQIQKIKNLYVIAHQGFLINKRDPYQIKVNKVLNMKYMCISAIPKLSPFIY